MPSTCGISSSWNSGTGLSLMAKGSRRLPHRRVPVERPDRTSIRSRNPAVLAAHFLSGERRIDLLESVKSQDYSLSKGYGYSSLNILEGGNGMTRSQIQTIVLDSLSMVNMAREDDNQ